MISRHAHRYTDVQNPKENYSKPIVRRRVREVKKRPYSEEAIHSKIYAFKMTDILS